MIKDSSPPTTGKLENGYRELLGFFLISQSRECSSISNLASKLENIGILAAVTALVPLYSLNILATALSLGISGFAIKVASRVHKTSSDMAKNLEEEVADIIQESAMQAKGSLNDSRNAVGFLQSQADKCEDITKLVDGYEKTGSKMTALGLIGGFSGVFFSNLIPAPAALIIASCFAMSVGTIISSTSSSLSDKTKAVTGKFQDKVKQEKIRNIDSDERQR